MKIAQNILEILQNSTTNGNELFLQGTFNRKDYVATNKVLEACGGKWNKKSKSHVFPTDAEERLEQILLTGEVEIPKDEFEYFPTPSSVVNRLVELSDVVPGMKMLEPEAGQGAIAIPFRELGCDVSCYELSEANFNVLKSLNLDVIQSDFLQIVPEEKFDLVVMNPPFSKQQDIKHVLHAFKFLKPNGILVSVMCGNVLWRDNKLTKDFREFISTNGSVEKLPEQSFKSSGTNVGTVIVKLKKG